MKLKEIFSLNKSLIEQTKTVDCFLQLYGSNKSSGCSVGMKLFAYFGLPIANKRLVIISA